MTHIRNQTARDLEAESKALPTHPAFAVIDLMVNEYKRPGKAAGAGFYDYPANGRKHLWAELKSRFEKPDAQISAEDVRDRLLFIQAIETVRCVEEGVLHSTADANIGSIFGIGFAAWSGGALQFINQYGLKDFIARAQYLVEQYGERSSRRRCCWRRRRRASCSESWRRMESRPSGRLSRGCVPRRMTPPRYPLVLASQAATGRANSATGAIRRYAEVRRITAMRLSALRRAAVQALASSRHW